MKQRLFLLGLVLVLVGCGPAVADTPTLMAATPPVEAEVPPTSVPATPQSSPMPADPTRQLVILYTSDEHGQMDAKDEFGGAAEMLDHWCQQEGYTEEGPYLVLSGGDMWTGPAISTWFEGESMAEVMNVMGYDAAAIGNHEFDFGLDGLRERAAQAEFPFLAANILDRSSGENASIAIPYVVQEVNGIQVGIIGLANLETPTSTTPDYVAGFDFAPYVETLTQVVPQVRADGAELLLVISHLCGYEMEALAQDAAGLGIALIGGGHCHQSINKVVDGVRLIESGANMQAYIRVDLSFDTATDEVLTITAEEHANRVGAADEELAALIDLWRAETDAALDHVIGYLEQPLAQRSAAMFNLLTDSWLEAYPMADVAMTNRGGFREGLPAGEITLAGVVGVLPFDNSLMDVELTGEQLVENLECATCGVVAGGVTRVDGVYQLRDGSTVEPTATYHVLVNDFMYAGGDGFKFREYDPEAYPTEIDWRQPMIDYLIALDTSPADPLDAYLDPQGR